MDDINHLREDPRVKQHHQLSQQTAKLTLFLQLLDEIDLLTVSEQSVSLDRLVYIAPLPLKSTTGVFVKRLVVKTELLVSLLHRIADELHRCIPNVVSVVDLSALLKTHIA